VAGSTVANPDHSWPEAGFAPPSQLKPQPSSPKNVPANLEEGSTRVQPPSLSTAPLVESRQADAIPLVPRLGTPRLLEPGLTEN
jgi:hypothetical protein